MFHWFDSRHSFTQFVSAMRPMSRAVEAHLTKLDSMSGWCCACQKITSFNIVKPPNDEWSDLRENIVCPCGLNGRMRAVKHAIDAHIEAKPETRFLMMERVTPLFEKISNLYPFTEGCEFFGADAVPGSSFSVGNILVRHENLMNLSYENETFDYLFHGDVLEHVPDHIASLKECHRTLKAGGIMLFTCPFFDFDEHLVRCRLVGDQLEHLLPAGYHGNPVSSAGSLVFTHHGWPLLEDLKAVGFKSVSIGLLYDPFQGIVSNNNSYPEGHMWPVIFRATK